MLFYWQEMNEGIVQQKLDENSMSAPDMMVAKSLRQPTESWHRRRR